MVNIDYLYNPAAVKDNFNKNYFLDKQLGFQVIEHGMILPNETNNITRSGVVDSNGKCIKNTGFAYGLVRDYTPPPESIQHSSETVIYLSVFHSCWGHCLTDHMRRVWFLKSEFFKNEFKNCPIVYIPVRNHSIESLPSFKRLLELLEVDVDRLRPITQPTQYEKIILPDESFLSPSNPINRGFTAEYRETINQLRDFALKNRTPTSIKKCYFFYGRKELGEERLAKYFKSKGYEVVRPEKLTLDEQLNLLINCESFASSIGSCSHNLMFLRDGTEVILIPRFWYPKIKNYQEILDQVHSLNINYVDSSLSLFCRTSFEGPFLFIVSEQLKRFFGDKWDGYDEDDFKAFLQYVKDSMGRCLATNPSTKDYYAPILEDFMTQLRRREDLITACNMPPRWENTFQPTISYQTHIHTKGWGAWQNEEQISGSTEDELDIQAVKINFPNHKVYYSVYYNAEEGWSEEVSNGEQAGTTGKSKAIYGIKIRLDEAGTKEFDILYRVHKFDDEWTPWAKNGETLYSYGQKLNALQIKLEPKT